MKMVSHNINQTRVRCTDCNERILRNREIVLNNKTICLGCAAERKILQKMDININHKLNCFKKTGDGDNDCHYCYVMTYSTMRKLGYESTTSGSWFKRTNYPNVLVIYE